MCRGYTNYTADFNTSSVASADNLRFHWSSTLICSDTIVLCEPVWLPVSQRWVRIHIENFTQLEQMIILPGRYIKASDTPCCFCKSQNDVNNRDQANLLAWLVINQWQFIFCAQNSWQYVGGLLFRMNLAVARLWILIYPVYQQSARILEVDHVEYKYTDLIAKATSPWVLSQGNQHAGRKHNLHPYSWSMLSKMR